jgi:hypothetical protein
MEKKLSIRKILSPKKDFGNFGPLDDLYEDF